ncbi:methyltransferase domain-containing protein [Modestobacter sp. I12A-02628]|uniref:Methyltransferase domain-containing protein n=1 Tax=Goekera deserti TaxID=2497753 RepID=A0A7K3W8P3_9ACTN|nr:class I SAM-dependent methyltransferase [Goekera deserti]MPR00235.1 methyltransferase domain-containing protein [Goekera deserti]NDI49409.1 methyltransferase domain-containing protein [Goekera deserti]NEL52717.1 methyltransferase domain-containing protein [Goekera deserti]
MSDDADPAQAAETVRQLRALATPAGAAALARASQLLTDRTDVVAALSRLRAEVGAELAGPAWGIARVRARARPVFGDDADRLLWTTGTLEQAGRPQLADRRAARLLAGGARSVADLGCASGTDTVALARAGARVLAVDRDPVARELTRANVTALGLGDVEVRDADVVDLVADAADGRVAGCDAAVLDPARRSGGRRVLDPDRWSPPWSTVTALLDRVPACVVKVAPGLDHERVPDGVEAEWVSVGGSIVEALLWGRGLSSTWRRATLVRGAGDEVLELVADTDPGRAPTAPVRAWLHEPDPAVIRSGLVATVADTLGATLVDPQIAYLTSDAASDSPWVSSYPVLDVLPFSVKRLTALLRARDVGRVMVKKRGSPVEPETLARRLRGPGSGRAVVVVTRVMDAPTAIVCGPAAPLAGPGRATV